MAHRKLQKLENYWKILLQSCHLESKNRLHNCTNFQSKGKIKKVNCDGGNLLGECMNWVYLPGATERKGKARLFSCAGEGKTFEYSWSAGLREGSERRGGRLESWAQPCAEPHRPVRGPPLLSPDSSSGQVSSQPHRFFLDCRPSGLCLSSLWPPILSLASRRWYPQLPAFCSL